MIIRATLGEEEKEEKLFFYFLFFLTKDFGGVFRSMCMYDIRERERLTNLDTSLRCMTKL